MAIRFRGLPTRDCPRCNVVIPLNETSCYNCGYKFADSQASSTAKPIQLPPASSARKDRSPTQTPPPFVYFISVFLALVIIAFAGVRAAGISLSLVNSNVAATPTPAYPLPKGTPLFADSFANDIYGWNLQSVPGNYEVAIANGVLSMEDDKNTLLWDLVPGERTYSNFKLVVNAVLSEGDQNNGYGIYIRGTSNQNSDQATYYRFELYGDGSYAIFKGNVDQSGNSTDTKIVDYTLSSAIQKRGALNHIMIIAKGPSLSLIVNDQLLKTFSDGSYTSGSIALFVSNLPEAKPGAQVQFSQLAIYPPQA